MTEEEFAECFRKPEPMLVREESGYYLSVDSRKKGKFDVVELAAGHYWVNAKGGTGWAYAYVEADGSYEAADSVYYLKESEFVLFPIEKPEAKIDW